MPRIARIKAEFCTYHVIQRGNERKNIFLSEQDKQKFIETLQKMKDKYNFLLYVYCLMNNHIHLVVNDNGNDISKIIKSINVSYALYFNRKYDRCGHLFQDRFKSQLIEDDTYLLEVSKYIHNNPVKASMVRNPKDYKWSSYKIYTGREKNYQNLIDITKILGQVSTNLNRSIREYDKYVNIKDEKELEIMEVEDDQSSINSENDKSVNSINEAKEKIERDLKVENLTYEELLKNKKKRDEMIREIRKNSTLTLKNIGDLFGGISESRISRILSE